MKKSFVAVSAGVLTGVVLLLSTAPAMAHDRIGFSLSVGVPIAPVVYGPAVEYSQPAYSQAVYMSPAYTPPAYGSVVYNGYAPVVRVGAPYYYGRDWRYYHGREAYYGHGYQGHHGWQR